MNIDFRGKYIGKVNINRISQSGSSISRKAAFVELKPNASVNDIKLLEDLQREFSESTDYISDIAECAKSIRNSNLNDVKSRFFVLTRQVRNYKRLNSNEILGIAMTSLQGNLKKVVSIDYLEVLPKYQAVINPAAGKIQHVGTAMLNSIKKLFKSKEIILDSVLYAVDFYKKNGFVEDKSSLNLSEKDIEFMLDNGLEVFVRMYFKK